MIRRFDKQARGRKPRRVAFRSMVETLESRCLLSTFNWKTAADGDFNAAASWLQNSVPGPNDDAVIGFSGITATSASSRSVNSLNSSARLTVTGGTFSVANLLNSSALAQLVVSAGATFQSTGGTTSLTGNAAILGNLDVTSGTLAFAGGTESIEAGATLTGAGLFKINGATFDVNEDLSAPAKFELDSGILGGTSTLTVGGTFTWTGGTMGDAGTTDIAASGTLKVTYVSPVATALPSMCSACNCCIACLATAGSRLFVCAGSGLLPVGMKYDSARVLSPPQQKLP